MNSRINDDWRSTIANWAQSQSAISKAWIYGSYAKGNATSTSDLDLAVSVDGDAIVTWIFNGSKWNQDLQRLLGEVPTVDLQLALPDDEIVWPAVVEHGILLFDRALQRQA